MASLIGWLNNAATKNNQRRGIQPQGRNPQVGPTRYAPSTVYTQPQQQVPPPFLQRPQPNAPLLTVRSPVQIGQMPVNNPQAVPRPALPPLITPASVGQGLARAPFNIGISIADAFKPGHQQINPQGTLKKIIGSQPVTSYQNRQQGLQKAFAGSPAPPNANLEQKVIAGLRQKLSVPLSIAGTALNASGDVGVVAPIAKGITAGIKVAAPEIGKAAVPIKQAANRAALSAAQLKGLDQAGKLRLPNLGGQNLSYSSGNGITKVSGKANQVRPQLTKLNEAGAVAPGGGDARIPKPPKLPVKMNPNALQNVFDQNPLKVPEPKTTGSERFPSAPNAAITPIDKVMANTSGKTAAQEAGQRLGSQAQSARNADAESAALGHLQKGGTRDEAIAIYKQTARTTQKNAAFRVQQAAKEAKQSLNTTKRTPNPLSNKFLLPNAKPGEYLKAPQNRNTVVNNITQAETKAYKVGSKLSANDRANIANYHEGTLDINKADNPALVKQAVAANTQLTDTVHALGEPYGKTPHIDKYFPRYLANAEDQSGKAQMAMEEAALAHKPIPLEDQGNYAGFHNKNRIFKTRQEVQNAGFSLLHNDPYRDLHRYATGAKINIGDQAFIKAAREADPQLQDETSRLTPLRMRGGSAVGVSNKAYRALKNYQAAEPSGLVKKALRGINTTVVKTIVANPIFHGGNQEFNAVFQGAWRLPGNKVANMAKVIKNHASVSADDVQNFYREGNFSPDYGKNRYGFIAKGLQKAGVNPAKAEISPRAMAAIEQNIRVGLWKIGKERNMAPEEITKVINKTLGGQDIAGDFSSSYGLFIHYLKTNIKLLGDVGVQAGKGNVAPLTGLALGAVGYMAAQKAWEKVTKNPNALVRAPGALGVGIQLGKIPGQLHAGKIPGIVTNHINPGLTTTVEQATNRDLKRAVVGKKSKYNSLEGKYGSGRLKTAARNLIGPAHTVQNVNDNRASLPAAALGYATGLYNSKLPPAKPPSLTKRQAKGNNPDELTRWEGMTNKARANVRLNNPDKYVRDQTLKVQQDQAQGNTTQAFKDQRSIAKTQIYRNYDKNTTEAYGLSATDFKAFVAQASPDEVNKLHSLDNQLVSAGLVSKSKFPKAKKVRTGRVARSGGRRGSGGVRSGRRSTGRSSGSRGVKATSFKITFPKARKITPPKGVKVKVPSAPKATKTRKLSVSKIPRIKVG